MSPDDVDARLRAIESQIELLEARWQPLIEARKAQAEPSPALPDYAHDPMLAGYGDCQSESARELLQALRARDHGSGLCPQPAAGIDALHAELKYRTLIDAQSLQQQQCCCQDMPSGKKCAWCLQQVTDKPPPPALTKQHFDLPAAIDELYTTYANKSGAVEDSVLERRVKEALHKLCEQEQRTYPQVLFDYVREHFVNPKPPNTGYTLADVAEFLGWVHARLGIEFGVNI